MPLSQRPDRQPLPVTVTPDLLKQLHPRSHPLCGLRSELDEARTIDPPSDRGGAKSSRRSGANSDRRNELYKDTLSTSVSSGTPLRMPGQLARLEVGDELEDCLTGHGRKSVYGLSVRRVTVARGRCGGAAVRRPITALASAQGGTDWPSRKALTPSHYANDVCPFGVHLHHGSGVPCSRLGPTVGQRRSTSFDPRGSTTSDVAPVQRQRLAYALQLASVALGAGVHGGESISSTTARYLSIRCSASSASATYSRFVGGIDLIRMEPRVVLGAASISTFRVDPGVVCAQIRLRCFPAQVCRRF